MSSMGFIKNTPVEKKQPNALVPINFTHAHAIGQTGCGKTTSFIYPNLSHRIKKGHAIVLYDFKGKEHLALKYFAKIHGREKDILEVGKPWGAKVNLIRMMSPNTLERFVETIIGTDAKDPYWPKSATNLFLNVYSVIRLLEKIHDSLDALKDRVRFKAFMQFELDLEHVDFTYPHQLSFSSVLHIAQSEENLAAFVSHLNVLQSNINHFFYQCLYDEKHEGRPKQRALIKKYARSIKHYVQLKTILNTVKNKLESYGKVNGENPKISIIMNLMPLSVVANDSDLNTDKDDLLEALSKGGIISINARDMSDEFTQGLNTAIFNELAKRSLLSGVQPISIFIDEAQRVMSKNSDYNLDVLRECKVELFLAYQNEALMEDKLGETKFKALKQNLSTAFYFRNQGINSEHETSELKDFQALSNKNFFHEAVIFKAIFLKQKELLQTEQRYLKKRKVYEKYRLKNFEESHIIVYDKLNYEEEKLIIVDIQSQRSTIQPLVNRSETSYIFKFAIQMYNDAQKKSPSSLSI